MTSLNPEGLKEKTYGKNSIEKILNNLYYTSGLPSAFSSAYILYREAKKKNPAITLNIVKEYLHRQSVYPAFKQIRYKFPRRKIELGAPNDTWQIDLAFLINLKNYNSGYQVIFFKMLKKSFRK